LLNSADMEDCKHGDQCKVNKYVITS